MKHLKKYQPSDSQPWDLLRVWTLHRRAGFAGTWSELQRDLTDGPEKSVARFFDATVRQAGVPDNFTEMSKIIGDAAVTSNRNERHAAWWMYQMVFSPDPLRERLTTMWHNHFATSQAKVKSLVLMHDQNEIFRRHAFDEFKSLLTATLKHGAMLKWLDGDENRAGQANENLGRETLELFTLGVGNYTEDDVKNASRALTGWSVYQTKFRVRDDWHDTKPKTILGKTGNFTGDDLIEITTDHKATARRLAWRLCREFLASSLVTDERTNELAEWLSQNELNIGEATKLILMSDAFYSAENMKRKLSNPSRLSSEQSEQLELFNPPASTIVLADWNEQLGRKLFYPPNVGGWPGGRAWLNSRTSIARANFGVALVKGNLGRTGKAPDLLALAKQHTGSANLDRLASFFGRLLTGSDLKEHSEKLVVKASENTKEESDVLRNVVSLILASPAAQLS